MDGLFFGLSVIFGGIAIGLGMLYYSEKKEKNELKKELMYYIDTKVPKLEEDNAILTENVKYKLIDQKFTTEEAIGLIDSIYNEVTNNKYLVNYRLRELTIIPYMDKEIEEITKDVMSALSEPAKVAIFSLYTKQYIASMLVRRAQYFLLDYQQKYGPKSAPKTKL